MWSIPFAGTTLNGLSVCFASPRYTSFDSALRRLLMTQNTTSWMTLFANGRTVFQTPICCGLRYSIFKESSSVRPNGQTNSQEWWNKPQRLESGRSNETNGQQQLPGHCDYCFFNNYLVRHRPRGNKTRRYWERLEKVFNHWMMDPTGEIWWRKMSSGITWVSTSGKCSVPSGCPSTIPGQ
jgi:hypothetical protein